MPLTQRQRFRNWLLAQFKDHGLKTFNADTKHFGIVNAERLLRDDTLPEGLFAELNSVNAAVANGRRKPLKGR